MPTKAMKPGEEPYAITCAVPVNSPGVRVINTTYHPIGQDTRHYPVSRRSSMPDGFVVFDDVYVPNERVFLDGQTEHASVFAHSLGMWERLGGAILMVQQADELVGLAQLIAEANGLTSVSHIREKIDEMTIHATLLRAGLEAALVHAGSTPEGFFYPSELYTNVAKYQGAAEFNRMGFDICMTSPADRSSLRRRSPISRTVRPARTCESTCRARHRYPPRIGCGSFTRFAI